MKVTGIGAARRMPVEVVNAYLAMSKEDQEDLAAHFRREAERARYRAEYAAQMLAEPQRRISFTVDQQQFRLLLAACGAIERGRRWRKGQLTPGVVARELVTWALPALRPLSTGGASKVSDGCDFRSALNAAWGPRWNSEQRLAILAAAPPDDEGA